jgi:hypothetical protein
MTVMLILLREPQIPYTDNLCRGEPIQRQHVQIILNQETQATKLLDLPAEVQTPWHGSPFLGTFLSTKPHSTTSQKTIILSLIFIYFYLR